MKIYLILACFVAAAGGFLFGFDTSVISGVIEYLVPKFGLDEIQKGWTVGCILIGCMVGERCGRAYQFKIWQEESPDVFGNCFSGFIRWMCIIQQLYYFYYQPDDCRYFSRCRIYACSYLYCRNISG